MLVNSKEDRGRRWAIATVLATTLPAAIKEVGQTVRAVMRERAIQQERAADRASGRPVAAQQPRKRRRKRRRAPVKPKGDL